MKVKIMKRMQLKFGIVISLLVLFYACTDDLSRSSAKHRFELLEPAATGLEASNILQPDVDFNVFNYMYYYNGGGVATGDFNQDGLEDIFFTFNQSSNRLY
ncbi:MAG: hypothetical protein AAGG75_04285, partial [Bacteroidota bacterium]